MTLKANAQFAAARHTGMNTARARRLAQKNLEADDLYTICQKCGTKLTGTLEEIKEGCDCAAERT